MSNETVVGGVYPVPPAQGGPAAAPAAPVVPETTGVHHTIQTPGTGVFERDQLSGMGDLTPELIDTPVSVDVVDDVSRSLRAVSCCMATSLRV